MCGIAGFVAPPRFPTYEQLQLNAVERMISCMSARGPDAEGLWEGEGVVLGTGGLPLSTLTAAPISP